MSVDAFNPDIGDLFLENGTVRLTNSLTEEVAQELFIRFRTWQSEWFLDPTVGIPYLQTILGQKTDIGIVAQIFRQVITTCPGVSQLNDFTVTRPDANRSITVTFSCTLTDGTVLLSSDFGSFVIGGQ